MRPHQSDQQWQIMQNFLFCSQAIICFFFILVRWDESGGDLCFAHFDLLFDSIPMRFSFRWEWDILNEMSGAEKKGNDMIISISIRMNKFLNISVWILNIKWFNYK